MMKLYNLLKKLKTLTNIFVMTVFLAVSQSVTAQNLTLMELEQAFAQIDSLIQQKQQQRSTLAAQVQKYGADIQKLKNKTALNFFQRQKLDKNFKESQDISKKIERIDSELRKLNGQLKKAGKKLLNAYDVAMNENLKHLEQKELAPDRQAALVRELADLRVKRDRMEQAVNPPFLSEVKITELHIDADDSPQQVARKADLLKDQEDKLRRLSMQIRDKVLELKKEQELQNRMADLVTDIAFFDQQEESFSELSTASEKTALTDEEVSPLQDFTSGRNILLENIFASKKDFDISRLSPQEFEEIIASLIRREQRLSTRADSLAQRAKVFYQTAEDMKKQ